MYGNPKHDGLTGANAQKIYGNDIDQVALSLERELGCMPEAVLSR
jgi:hypothetical protein